MSKIFPGQQALDRVDLDLEVGKVHAVVGENGSGKSTLIKILAGYHEPEAGAEAWLDGEPFQLGSANSAEQAGIRFIHQDLGLVGSISALDNLAMGRGYRSRWWVSDRREALELEQLMQSLGVTFDPRAPVASLSPVERTMLAVARAFREDGTRLRVIVLDEPTESLIPSDVRRLFEMIRAVLARGVAVLYVSHRLEEVLEIADQVTVLRDGRVVGVRSAAGLSHSELVQLILGRSEEGISASDIPVRTESLLSVRHLRGGTIADFSLDLAPGEILGVAGVLGSGRDVLPYLLGGAESWISGVMSMDGSPVVFGSPRDALRAGIVLVAADRQQLSAIPDLTVRENLMLPRLESGPAGWIGGRAERREALRWMAALNVVPLDSERLLATLSGGNQQKVVLARALRCKPRVLILDEPVQGVDVGARAAINQELLDAAAEGVGIVISSSDAEELAAVCRRVIVLSRGRISAELSGDEISAASIVARGLKVA